MAHESNLPGTTIVSLSQNGGRRDLARGGVARLAGLPKGRTFLSMIQLGRVMTGVSTTFPDSVWRCSSIAEEAILTREKRKETEREKGERLTETNRETNTR